MYSADKDCKDCRQRPDDVCGCTCERNGTGRRVVVATRSKKNKRINKRRRDDRKNSLNPVIAQKIGKNEKNEKNVHEMLD